MSIVRKIQEIRMKSSGMDDIGYNFLVGGDGAVYTGWDNEGAHTKGHNKRSIGIGFVGSFTFKTPPKRQLDAAQQLIAEGVELRKIRPNYSLYGQCQLGSTDSPGAVLYDIMKKWSHWSERVE